MKKGQITILENEGKREGEEKIGWWAIANLWLRLQAIFKYAGEQMNVHVWMLSLSCSYEKDTKWWLFLASTR